MKTKSQAHITAIRAEDKRREDERLAELKRRKTNGRPFGAPYGNSSSYSPASDTCSAPFVPAAENYTPAPSDASPSYDGGGGSFDGGGGSFDGGGASGGY